MSNECRVLIVDQTMITVKKKIFFSFPTSKNIMLLDSAGSDMWTEKGGDCRKNHPCIESILDRTVIKHGLKERDID